MTPPPAGLAAVLRAGPAVQRPFTWSRLAWRNQMRDVSDVRDLLSALPAEVDRGTTRQAVLRELDQQRVIPAFVAAMVWGYGTTAYGPGRVRWVLTGHKGVQSYRAPVKRDEVTKKLRDAVDIVRNDGAAKAYAYMYSDGRLKHLGGAFFTKWLYFISAVDGVDAANAAPILDTRVTDWLREIAVIGIHPNRTKSYVRYLEVLDDWGDQYDRTRVQVEQAIFELTRS